MASFASVNVSPWQFVERKINKRGGVFFICRTTCARWLSDGGVCSTCLVLTVLGRPTVFRSRSIPWFSSSSSCSPLPSAPFLYSLRELGRGVTPPTSRQSRNMFVTNYRLARAVEAVFWRRRRRGSVEYGGQIWCRGIGNVADPRQGSGTRVFH